MVTYQTILCPVDFSPHAANALKHALLLADKFDSRLVLLHVYDLPGTVTESGINEDMLALQEGNLREFALEHSAGAMDLETAVIMGSIGEEIIATAYRLNTELIVMGSHGYSMVERLLLGSTAEYILEHSNIPVLIVRI